MPAHENRPFINGQDLPESGLKLKIENVRSFESKKDSGFVGHYVDVVDSQGTKFTISVWEGNVLETQLLRKLIGQVIEFVPATTTYNDKVYINVKQEKKQAEEQKKTGFRQQSPVQQPRTARTNEVADEDIPF